MSVVSLSCPASNGTSFVSNGQTFNIRCGYNWPYGDIRRVQAASFTDCVTQCSTSPGCIDSVYFQKSKKCWLKKTLTKYKIDENSWGAILASVESVPSCTNNQYDGTVYTTIKNIKYEISCGLDSRNNDISGDPSPDFGSCLSSCDADSTCLGVAYKTSLCFLKHTIVSPLTTDVKVAFARKIVDTSSSSTTSSASSSTTPGTTLMTSTISTTSDMTSSIITTATTTTTTISTTSSDASTTTTPAASGPCANGAAFAREVSDQQGNAYGVCENTDFPGSTIRGGDVPHDLNAADADTYCANLCSSVGGCILATAINNYCYVKDAQSTAQASSGTFVFARKNPPGPGSGPCFYGQNFASQVITTNGDVYGFCPNTDLLGSDISTFIMPSGVDRTQACAEACSGVVGCVSATYHEDRCYLKNAVPGSSSYVGLGTVIKLGSTT